MELRLDLGREWWIVIAGDSAGALVDVFTYGCGRGRAKLPRPLGRRRRQRGRGRCAGERVGAVYVPNRAVRCGRHIRAAVS